MSTRTTRLPTDLIDAAEAEGAQQQRSASKQLEHWARLGMQFDHQTTAMKRRIQRAGAGATPLADLTDDERLIANAQIDASISAAANSTSFADRLAARGVTTVVMDADGRMIRREPDGTSTVV